MLYDLRWPSMPRSKEDHVECKQVFHDPHLLQEFDEVGEYIHPLLLCHELQTKKVQKNLKLKWHLFSNIFVELLLKVDLNTKINPLIQEGCKIVLFHLSILLQTIFSFVYCLQCNPTNGAIDAIELKIWGRPKQFGSFWSKLGLTKGTFMKDNTTKRPHFGPFPSNFAPYLKFNKTWFMN